MFKSGSIWGRLDKFRRNKIKHVGSKAPMEIQDFDKTPIFMGADVKALYPSMEQSSTAELAFRAVLNSPIQYDGVDYELLLLYLKLILGDMEMRKLGLGHVIPIMKEPDNSFSLLTKKNREKLNWHIKSDLLNEVDKRVMVAAMVKIAVITMSQTICYSFGPKTRLH